MKASKKILLIGVDGSGKTSLSQALAAYLDGRYLYLGEKYFCLKFLEKLNKESRVVNIFYLIVLLPLDLYFRWNAVRRSKVLLVDRVPSWSWSKNRLLRFIYNLALPRFDCVVFCTGSVEVFFERKREKSIQLLHKDNEKWRRFFNDVQAPVKIELDTSRQTLEESLLLVYNQIYNSVLVDV